MIVASPFCSRRIRRTTKDVTAEDLLQASGDHPIYPLVPLYRWMVYFRENPIKMDHFGVPPFQETFLSMMDKNLNLISSSSDFCTEI